MFLSFLFIWNKCSAVSLMIPILESYGMMEQLFEEVAEDYRRMSLPELLAEENMMARFFHKRISDSPRKKLRAILRSEIEKKLL